MKIFTVQEANALIPNVRNILARIQQAYKNVSRYRTEARKAADGAEQGGGGMVEGVAYAKLLTKFTALLTDLEGLGVQLKDYERGAAIKTPSS